MKEHTPQEVVRPLESNFELIEDKEFSGYIHKVEESLVPSRKVDGFYRLGISLHPLINYFPEHEVLPNSARVYKQVQKIENLNKLRVVHLKNVYEPNEEYSEIVADRLNSLVAFSYLYGRVQILGEYLPKKNQLDYALNKAASLWGEQPMNKYIIKLKESRSKPEGPHRLLNPEQIEFDVQAGILREGREVKLREKKGIVGRMIPTLDQSKLQLDTKDLARIFLRMKEASQSRTLYRWEDYTAEDVIEAVRFIQAVGVGKESEFRLNDRDYSPRDFLKDINYVGNYMLELQAKMKVKGIDCELSLGDVFELKKRSVEKRSELR